MTDLDWQVWLQTGPVAGVIGVDYASGPDVPAMVVRTKDGRYQVYDEVDFWRVRQMLGDHGTPQRD